jgi:acyl-CoA dehydrogenase
MDFRLTDEQLEFKRLCRRFATEVIRPIAGKHDREQSVPWEAIGAAREWRLHGVEHLQRMGSDPDGVIGVIYAEELHWGCAGIALAIQASSLAAAGIAASGTPEHMARATRSSWARTRSPSRARAPTSSRFAPPPGSTATSGS